MDVKKDYKNTFGELCEKYIENFKHQSSFRVWKKYCIERFEKEFGELTLLSNINYMLLESYRSKLRTKLTKRGKLRKDATINREMSCLHHMFSKACEWELMERSPFDRGKTLLLKENNKRERYLELDEIYKLLAICPTHLRKIVECVPHTGMRKQEVLSLKWEQIQGNFIYLKRTKTNESRQIPINETLAGLFRRIRKEQQLRSQYVFTHALNEDKLLGNDTIRRKNKLAPVPQNIGHIFKSFKSYKEGWNRKFYIP